MGTHLNHLAKAVSNVYPQSMSKSKVSNIFNFYSCRQNINTQDVGLCENKCADQLRRNCTAEQCLRFHYTDSDIIGSQWGLLTRDFWPFFND